MDLNDLGGRQLDAGELATLTTMRAGSIDLDSVPRVKAHFARLVGTSKSDAPIMDHRLHESFMSWRQSMEDVLSSVHPDVREAEVMSRGFLSLKDYELVKSVLDEPGKWQRSRPDLSALFRALAGYGTRRGISIEEEAYSEAIKDLKASFTTVTPLKASNLDEELPVQRARSSGFPRMVSKQEDFSRALTSAQRLIRSRKRSDPCVCVHRIQQKAEGAKTRLAFAYPSQMTLLEGMFAPQIIQYVKDHVPWVTYATGYQDIARMTKKVRWSANVVEVDYSQFDASIDARLIRDCFDVLRDLFTLDEEGERAWSRVVEYFVNTPILMPDGNVYLTDRGVPSGSWFTNLIDSMVNYIATRYVYHRMGRSDVWEAAILGDDAIIGTKHSVDLTRLTALAAELGLTVSVEKSRQMERGEDSNNFTLERVYYLGHHWTSDGVWFRPLHITVARLVYHERYVHSLTASELRWSRLYAHSVDNPLARVLLLEVLRGDAKVRPHSDDTRHRELFQELLAYQGDASEILPATGYLEFLQSLGLLEDLQPSIPSWDEVSTWGVFHPRINGAFAPI